MPRPPSVSAFSEIEFVTQAYLLGCEFPTALFVELSKDDLKSLALLLFGLDGFDIAQAVFDPRKGRRRKPSRKGRKRNRGAAFPDVNDIIGGTVPADIDTGAVFRFGAGRYVFALLGAYEAVNFSVALVEGISDVGFNSLIGAFKLGQVDCGIFPAAMRTVPTQVGIFTGGGSPVSFPISKLEFNSLMGTNNQSMICPTEEWECAITIEVTPSTGIANASGYFFIEDAGGNIVAQSGVATVVQGETASLELVGNLSANQAAIWRFVTTLGKLDLVSGTCLGFSVDTIPWL